MSTIQKDFDRIALVSPDGSLQNNLYHNFLLRHLRSSCQAALEIGCGKGEFSRRLAATSERVLALDLSPEMHRQYRDAASSAAARDVFENESRPETRRSSASA
jgi:ubiquinone/menaquinone biosynthesis C-methylase UbiE